MDAGDPDHHQDGSAGVALGHFADVKDERWLGVLGVPYISACALAIFRALLGFAFLGVLIYHPIQAVPRADQRAYSPLAELEWVQALAASGTGTFALQSIGCAAAALFALGIRARPSYFVLVTVLLLHATILLVRRGVHDWDVAIVTLLALVIVPWGSAPPLWSLGARLRSTSGETSVSRLYGFAVWLPGLTLGLAYAAAAYAKLSRSGFEWISSGAVRYHFVEDGRNTPFVFGLWVATHPTVAMTLSLLAILVEATLIAVVFVASWRARMMFGLAALALMGAFYVFQGVLWWPWLILLSAFLPWNGRHGVGVVNAGRDLTWTHAAVVAVVVTAQVLASYQRLEIEPLVSNYPMYSHTYESPEQFDRDTARVRFESEGVDITERVETAGGADVLRRIAMDAGEQRPVERSREALADFGRRFTERYGAAPSQVDVVVLRNPFDWQRGRYLPPALERLGTVHLATGIIDPTSSLSGGASRGDP